LAHKANLFYLFNNHPVRYIIPIPSLLDIIISYPSCSTLLFHILPARHYYFISLLFDIIISYPCCSTACREDPLASRSMGNNWMETTGWEQLDGEQLDGNNWMGIQKNVLDSQ
jgi:hypothetical protein